MIVKNEQVVLERCLASVQDIVDEIIIVDTGSTDRTKEIARLFTDKIYNFKWINDFSAARNFSFSYASKDYILWLDADDVLLEEDRVKLKQLKVSIEPSVDAVMMKYNYAFDEFGKVILSFYRERLVKRSLEPKWQDPIHEFIGVIGYVINSDICVTHKRIHQNTDRNLKIFEVMLSGERRLTPRNLFYYAQELYYHNRYDEAIQYFKKFIDTNEGWVEDVINACYLLSVCYGALKDEENYISVLYNSFVYDLPRAEICCQLGAHYFNKENYHKAIFWYELATQLERPKSSWGFILEDCWGFLPNIQLCVCYDREGDIEKAIKYNDVAAEYKPQAPAVLHNKSYFEELKNPLTMDHRWMEGRHHENGNLRIVMVAPDIYPIPPQNYGGIERVVYDLTEELVKMGHEVFLFAPKYSASSANIMNYQHYGPNPEEIASFVKAHLPKNIDIIHDHTHASIVGRENLSIPTVCTIHTPVTNSVKYPIYISRRAREILAGGKGYFSYNGINPDEFEFSEQKEDYILYMGMLAWYKGITHLLELAERTGQKLIIAGPIYDMNYYRNEIETRITNNVNIEYIGEVGGQQRQNLLKHAKYLLLPTICEEPFGLILVEAMACGTAPLAFSNGAIPEILREFPQLICSSVDEMVDKVLHQQAPDPLALRKYALENFSRGKMAETYVKIYSEIIVKSNSNS
jgi:glycosyltransferase involved in cell wall biosynthesis